MNEKKLLIFFVFITSILLFGGVILVGSASSTPQVTSTTNAKVVANQETVDWGSIPMNGGNVSQKFSIKNTGSENLKLMNIRTSCHCTKAYVVSNGSQSPYFGMDGASSWVGQVAPGKEATLMVIFDPAFHGPAGVGPVERYVSVETNDVNNSKLTFTMKGTVIK